MYIATRWNPIYWDTACLIVNSATLTEEEKEEAEPTEEIVSIYEVEDDDDVEYEDLPDRRGKIKKNKSADYAKTAKALGDIITQGVKVSLIDINKSSYSFKPDAKNNQILFALKALSGVNAAYIDKIIANRPYESIMDFMDRCELDKKAMISLIKSGAFDNLVRDWAEECKIEPRKLAMIYYLSVVSEPKKKLTLQNMNGLLERNLLPEEVDFEKRVYKFNKYLKDYCKNGTYYCFIDPAFSNFYNEFFDTSKLEMYNNMIAIPQKTWDAIYQKSMDPLRAWLKANEQEVLKQYNYLLFKAMWDKYAQGSIASWEIDAVCFYHSRHELADINASKYGIVDFKDLPEEPVVDKFWKRNGHDIPIFKISKIVGTVIAKNDTKHLVSILTTSGVVNVKFTNEYYAMYKRQISEVQADGKKKVIEKGWFKRGTKILVAGFRREDTFVGKSYSNSGTHQLYKITDIADNGDIVLIHDRKDAT